MAYNYDDKASLTYLMSKLHTWITNNLVRQEEGKGLSANNYTDEEKEKLANIEEEANKYILPSATEEELGGVIVGDGIFVDEDGVISISKSYNDLTDIPTLNGVEIKGTKSLEDFDIQSTLVFNTAYDKDTNKVATMTDVTTAVTSAYKPKGSIAFEDLPTENIEVGWVYDITNDFITDERFKEGAGKKFPAGTNIVYTVDKLWDVFSGFIDTSHFVLDTDLVPISTSEIDAMFSDWI